MRRFLLFFALAACGGGQTAPASDVATAAVPATPPAPAPGTAAPAAEVGPDGPADIAVPAFTVPTDADAVTRGKAVFDAKGCGGCHAFGSVLVGPDLNGVGARRTDTWIAKMFLHPDEMTKKDPNAKTLLGKHMVQMPNQGVEDGQIGDLIAFLKSHP